MERDLCNLSLLFFSSEDGSENVHTCIRNLMIVKLEVFSLAVCRLFSYDDCSNLNKIKKLKGFMEAENIIF